MTSLRTFSLIASALLLMPLTAFGKTCELAITGNDQMQYDQSELVVGSDCEKVKLTLEHVGQLAVEQMGHNWVLTKSSDYQAVAQAGSGAGLSNDYLPKDDDRVLAATDMIGGGETTSVTFDVSSLASGGDYTYFCSFPGHYSVMKGKLVVK
jgi:azurin